METIAVPTPNRKTIPLTRPTSQSIFSPRTDTIEQATVDAQAIGSFCADARARNLRSRTVQGYADRLDTLRKIALANGTTTLGLTKQGIRGFLLNAGTHLAPTTIHALLRVWRAYYKWCIMEGLLTTSPVADIPLPRLDNRIPPVLKSAQIELLLDHFDTGSFYGRRDFTLTVVLYDTMIRVGEAVALTLDDVLPSRSLIISRSKNRNHRLVPISADPYAVLDAYITGVRRTLPGDALFCSHAGEPMTTHRIQQMYRDFGLALGFRCYPHLLRHSGATDHANAGMPLRSLQKMLGHARLSTTEVYVHPDEQVIRDHHDKYSPASKLRILGGG